MSQSLEKIRKELKAQKFDAMLISSVSLITYLTDYANFSGEEREAFLLITSHEQFILTDGRYSEAIKKLVKNFQLIQIGGGVLAEKVLEDLAKKYKIENLGIDERNINVAEYKLLKKVFPTMEHIDLSNVRAIKSEEEIKKIQRACRIGDEAFEYIKKKVKSELTESQIADILEKFIREKGARLSFEPIIAFDKNSSIPHHLTGKTKIGEKKGQFLKMDFGVKFENYCSDMTRTVFWGKPSERQMETYETVKVAQEKVVEYLLEQLKKRTEILAGDVDKVARDYIISQGYPSIPHALGHGVGLEVHEYPAIFAESQTVLKEGMVFSIEPGIYIEGFGGVRIEDLFGIAKGKLIKLTKSPRDLTII